MKSELFRNGIRAEIRSNPLADALRVSRVELWLQDERDYFEASKLYVAFQERGTADPKTEGQTQSNPEPEVYIDAEELPAPKTVASRKKAPVVTAPAPKPPPTPAPNPEVAKSEDLAEVSGLLEKDIEQLLARDQDLAARSASLEKTILALEKSLGDVEARARAEGSARADAEKRASEMAEGQASLKRQLAERTVAEERLEQVVTKLRGEVKAREQAAATAVAKLETQVRELRDQQTIVIALRNELAAREQQLKELGESLTQAGMALGSEKQARVAAEERLSECAVARAALEQQVAQQTQELHQVRAELQTRNAQVQAYVGRLNTIRSRLQGKG